MERTIQHTRQQCYSLLKEVADSFPDYIDNNWSVLLMEAAVKAYSIEYYRYHGGIGCIHNGNGSSRKST